MPSYAAFLRGMNVGGHRLTNEQLRGHLVAMGFADVATFRASGNVVFAAADQAPAELAARIEQGLAAALDYAVPTFIRDTQQICAIAALQPFGADRVGAAGGKLQVMLLGGAPSPSARKTVLELASDDDRLAFGEHELYWLPRGGMLDSALELKAIEKLLGVMTMRTKGTVEQIANKHFAEQPRGEKCRP
jgi:uncharacterized protein (DUF1697 family)